MPMILILMGEGGGWYSKKGKGLSANINNVGEVVLMKVILGILVDFQWPIVGMVYR